MAGFYTGKGDGGFTGILGEGRLPKYHPILDAIGSIDEATAALGFARAQSLTPGINSLLVTVQRDLYHIMAELAASPENVLSFRMIDAERVAWLEKQIQVLSVNLKMPTEFIVPGDSISGAAFALTRTVVRRAERNLTRLVHEKFVENQQLLRYLNRLSSLCFLLELLENHTAGIGPLTLATEPE